MIMWYIASGRRPDQGTGHNVEWRPDLNMVDWVELRPIIAQAWSAQPQMRPSALECIDLLLKLEGINELLLVGSVPKASCTCTMM